ncbi:hypothetical protein SLS56_005250 [Neofusicoccum ribis]|uniref:Zn(2)-C6 fungal-type domain-containing protein n=1 Tax=Neofusicoccum ribis TaxID=45134 RepID=A0ABR3STY9_9PEZI
MDRSNPQGGADQQPAYERSVSQSSPLPDDPPPGASQDGPSKKRQKRNKPTLSCDCCVERKTKCDRGRPQCLACIKRQSECRYSEVANLIASAERNGGRATSKARKKAMEQAQLGVVTPSSSEISRAHRGPKHQSSRPLSHFLFPYTLRSFEAVMHHDYGFWIYAHHPANDLLELTELHEHQGCPRPQQYRSQSTSSTSSSVHQLLSNVPTCRGGLAEVIGVLPRREQADILVAQYFEAVDPVYPMIHRGKFDADYERFWSLPHEEKCQADSALLALHFVIYAMGTQFIQMNDPQERAQIAEFYVSAAHQALRISGYLSRISLRTIQAMVLINYFLMNNNHASDAWSFGGVLMRQAYAMGLNRDPELIVPRASALEKQQRRKVWQAVLFQDTFLTVLLKLPPTATISDVHVESLTDDPEGEHEPASNLRNTPEALPNPMRISNIAPPPTSLLPHEVADREYIRTMWRLANLVQRNLMMARLLVIQQQPESPFQRQTKAPIEEQLLVAAKHDIRKVIEILDHVGSGAPEMQKTRTEVLRTAFEDISW